MTLILLTALLILPVILLFSFVGCQGDDPVLTAEEKKALEDAGIAVAIDAARYFNKITSTSTLLSYWRLGEVGIGGTTAKDSVPPAIIAPLDGTYLNVQGISFGEKGALEPVKHPDDKAAEFLGTQGYVEVPYNALRNPPHSFSVELWLRPRGNETTPQVVIGSYRLNPAGNVVMGFVLDVLRDTVPARVRARLGNGVGSTAIEASLGDGLIHDGWRHVVMTYSKPSQALMLYVNADDGKPDAQQPDATNTAPVTYTPVPLGAGTPLRIAAGQPEAVLAAAIGAPAATGLTYFFNGRLDEVSLYNDVLDGATIRAHYLSATSGPI